MTQYLYKVFGEIISSEFPIEVLPEAKGEDATVWVKQVSGIKRPPQEVDPFFKITPDVQFFHWNAVGSFEIKDPSHIYVEPNDDVSWRLVSQPLLGIVISVLLERRGYFCLHGGAVDVDGCAAIVLGDKGAGKSTTVSSLLRSGRKLLTDDLVALDCSDPEADAIVQTGFPAVKLWPDSAEALAVDTEKNSELIHPSITKIQKSIDQDIMAEPKPAKAIFILSRTENEEEETYAVPLNPATALQSLLYFAFIARFGNTSLGPEHLSKFMERCCYVVKTTKVYELKIKRDLAALDDLSGYIAKVCAESTSEAAS